MAAAAGPAGRVVGQFVDWIEPGPVVQQIGRVTNLIPVLAAIAVQYIAIGVFGPNFWHSKGVDAGAVRPIDPGFYDFWHGLDPVDPTRRVCDTHHPPVWIPAGLSLATVERAGLQFSLNDTNGLRQHRNTHISGGYYAVMRKEVLGRGLPEAELIRQLDQAGYPGLAQAADVAAVIFAINQYDGSRWLGDETGAEKCWTFTHCIERVAFDERECLSAVGGFSPSGVYVRAFAYEHKNIGVAALRKF